MNEERRALLAELVANNTSISLMQKTYGFNYKTVRKHYPNYRVGKSSVERDYYQIKDLTTLRLAVRLVSEEAPMSEIVSATGLTRDCVLYHFPTVPWSRSQVGSYGGLIGLHNHL